MASSPVATESLYGFFGPRGRLEAAHRGYEYRPGQLEMARAVRESLEKRRNLLVEAGTGTGKTLAYLLPALNSRRRVVVSTGTKNLQEQLVLKDVPLLEKALGRPLNVVCMKGRNNYACRQKVGDLENQTTLIGLEELDLYTQIKRWIPTSEIGDRAELDDLPERSMLWERLNARRETCTGQKCPQFDDCFLTRLHRRAMEADLVVVNHHLFFADLALKQRDLPGVLPPYEAVVFDEAHELEDVAGLYFGVSISNYQIDEVARDADATLKTARLWSEALGERVLRVREAGVDLLQRVGARDGRHAFTDREGFLAEHGDAYGRFMQSLAGLKAGLETLQQKPEEIHTLLRRLEEISSKTAYLLESADRSAVFWYERRGRGVFLQATPILLAGVLRETLFGALDTVVLTSATLAVNGSFEYLRSRLGVDHTRECIVASPFDYARQALLYVPSDLPDPRSDIFGERAADEIEYLLNCSRGRAFVLCTSHEQMRRLHQRLEPRLAFPVLLQGSAPRHLLLERFRKTPHAVLFATSSFWQGVDVQGEQLSCVIIDRLPFASPGDPVVAARIRAIQESGGNAFAEFQVPEAVLALKQGFGRLIRSRRDRGVLALLDNRILRQRYGAVFFDSLPPYPRTTIREDVKQFFER